jgi:hypothetical protein
LALIGAASLMTAANAAAMSPASKIQPWLGTWSCQAAGNPHSATFTPIFGGNAMRISETGKEASEEIIVFDTKRNKWIDQYADVTGAYSTMEGTQNGKTITFRQVYPGSGPVLTVTMVSKNKYTTNFAATMNGKKMTEHETCTK